MLSKIQNKHILLDTNLIVNSARYQDAFAAFFIDIKKYSVKPALDSMVRLEFLRSANTLQVLRDKQEFLALLYGETSEWLDLPVSEEIFTDARRISNLYYSLGIKTPSITDCMLAAQVKNHQDDLLLPTINNKDFPLKIFDRISLYAIGAGDNPFCLGIYAFSEKKYGAVVANFTKSNIK